MMRNLLPAIALLLLTVPVLAQASDAPADRPPNFVIIFCDDLGYGDIGSFGAKGYTTPNLDRMAQEGVRFTNFYVPQGVCSASRAALMTGCYSNRVSILGALFPGSPKGIHDNEVTMAEMLKTRGYATAIFGKWHLGSLPQFLPLRHGFDEYFGLPYSNDMYPKPDKPNAKGYPPLPLIEGEKVVQESPDQSRLTTWYAEHAVDFINRHKDQPFFLYVPNSMPHVPLAVSDKFKGKSEQGLFGDVVMEIDWQVGQIFDALRKNGLDEQTLVIFTSDNGPWLTFGNHAGSAGPLREGKGTEFEGGVREPTIMCWPGHIPAGSVCNEPAMTIDLFPTLAKLAGAELPKHKIDGLDIWPLMASEPGAKTPHEALYFYWGRELQAVRSGKWKLQFPHEHRSQIGPPGRDGKSAGSGTAKIGLELFDLDADIGEKTNVAAQHPDVVQRLQTLADKARADLGDSLTSPAEGPGVRPAGMLEGK